MNKFAFILLLIVSSTASAQQGSATQQTYTQNEIDLKFQLQEQKIEIMQNTINVQNSVISDNIIKQDKYIDSTCGKFSNHISFWSGWMTFISLSAAIIIALIGWFIYWKFRNISKEVNNELIKLKEIKDRASMLVGEALLSKSEIEKLRAEVIEFKNDAENHLSRIKVNAIEVSSLMENIKGFKPDELPIEKTNKISAYIEEIKQIKTEIELTSEDWFLKGYNAQVHSHFNEAIIYFEQAIKLDPNFAEAYNSLGGALSCLAKQDSSILLYEKSISKFERAIELKPNYAMAYYNLGTILLDLTKLQDNEMIYQRCFPLFEKAIELNPVYRGAYLNYGNALYELARKKSSENLYQKSITQYKQAISNDPNEFSAYYNLGLALRDLAVIKSDEKLFHESFIQYQNAINLAPDKALLYDNYAAALLNFTALNGKIEEYKEKIEELLNKAKHIDPMFGAYNLACLYARINKYSEAFNYLEIELKNKNHANISRSRLEADSDFNNIKNDPKFKKLLDQYLQSDPQ